MLLCTNEKDNKKRITPAHESTITALYNDTAQLRPLKQLTEQILTK